jgi:tryptophanyl-tRNA synthetase
MAKMSTSKGGPGVLWVIEDDKQTLKKIKSAVTDTGREVVYDVDEKPGISNLLTIQSVATGQSVDSLVAAYDGKGYGDFKGDVAEAVIAMFAPIRTRFAELMADPGYLDTVLREGAAVAGPVAAATMRDVRDRVGLLAPA